MCVYIYIYVYTYNMYMVGQLSASSTSPNPPRDLLEGACPGRPSPGPRRICPDPMTPGIASEPVRVVSLLLIA